MSLLEMIMVPFEFTHIKLTIVLLLRIIVSKGLFLTLIGNDNNLIYHSENSTFELIRHNSPCEWP